MDGHLECENTGEATLGEKTGQGKSQRNNNNKKQQQKKQYAVVDISMALDSADTVLNELPDYSIICFGTQD